jgi:hypothetical protein
MTTSGIDVSFEVQSAANRAIDIAADGYSFVGVYIGNEGSTKDLTASQAESFSNNFMTSLFPLSMVSIFELSPDTASYFSNPTARADADAKDAISAAITLNQPVGTAIYFTVDFEPTIKTEFDNIKTYFERLRTDLDNPLSLGLGPLVQNVYKLGAYGPGDVLTTLVADPAANPAYTWLAFTRNGFSGENLQQIQNDYMGDTPYVLNFSHDLDSAKTLDFGQWSLRSDTTPPNDPQSLLPVAVGGTATISHNFLWTDDPDNTADQLTYTIMTGPAHGIVLDNGVAATSFTQTDIDNGLVQYVENGDPARNDAFTFQVSDSAGNRTETHHYSIAILDQTGPVVAGDSALSLPLGGGATLRGYMLDTVALGSTPDQIIYQVTVAPQHGALLINGAPFSWFTQSDVDHDLVQYGNAGDGASSDSFSFVAWDANAEWTAGTFNMAIQPNGAIGNSAAPQAAAGGSDAGGWQGSVPDGYQMAGVGDFHGNGASDILLRDPTSGDVAELRADQGMNFRDIGWAGPGWEVAGTVDVNGDGTTDILFDFPGSGATGAFVMNDGHPTWTPLGSTPA